MTTGVESPLDKVLRLADVSQLEPAAVGKVDKGSGDDEAHEHLMRECPWYEHIDKGGNPWGDADHWCTAAKGKGGPPRLVVKLTPRTAEASTVPEPTVPPGGPGLFHIKGLELPPYIQHLWHHLAARYGKHRAYGIAVGVVKKWAQGVNPGGWNTKSGKGKRTHPDVRAAAQKNVAQWEADIAKAHAHSGHSSTEEGVALVAGKVHDYPGRAQIPLPPVPSAQTTRAMFTAHRMDDLLRQLSHASERLVAAKASKAQRGYHMMHVNNHLSHVLNNAKVLADSLRKNYGPEGRELTAIQQTMELSKSLTPETKAATFAHLLQTIAYDASHAKRHAMLMLKPDPSDVWQFNYDHAAKHAKGALQHAFKLAQHIYSNYPAEAKYLALLSKEEDPYDPTTGLSALQDGPTLTKEQANYRNADVKDQNCGYCVNMVGSGCRLVQGPVSKDDTCDSWEGSESGYPQLAAPSAWPSGKAYQRSFLTPPGVIKSDARIDPAAMLPAPADLPRDAVISAPGAGRPEYAYGQLRQEPAQTVSPSPPLPPAVKLPTPEELTGFADKLKGMGDEDSSHHITGAVLHLTSAAEKIPNNPTSALASLRSAQMAIQDEWRDRVLKARPRIAWVYSVNTPPAEQSSAREIANKHIAAMNQMQEAARTVAEFIDRVRRAYFGKMGMENQTAGGGLAGQPNARLSSLERVVALAEAQVRPFTRLEGGREETVRQHEKWIPEIDWLKGERIWKERGEAAYRAHGKAFGHGPHIEHPGFEGEEPHIPSRNVQPVDKDTIRYHMATAHGRDELHQVLGGSDEELLAWHERMHHSGVPQNHQHLVEANASDVEHHMLEGIQNFPGEENIAKYDFYGNPRRRQEMPG